MQLLSIEEIEKSLRRGLLIKIDSVLFRNMRWQPYLEVIVSVESVREVPIIFQAAELYLSYNQEEVGPLPTLARPYVLKEPAEGIEIRMRKDLYHTLAEELAGQKKPRGFVGIRGIVIVSSPNYSGFIEVPVDEQYQMR